MQDDRILTTTSIILGTLTIGIQLIKLILKRDSIANSIEIDIKNLSEEKFKNKKLFIRGIIDKNQNDSKQKIVASISKKTRISATGKFISTTATHKVDEFILKSIEHKKFLSKKRSLNVIAGPGIKLDDSLPFLSYQKIPLCNTFERIIKGGVEILFRILLRFNIAFEVDLEISEAGVKVGDAISVCGFYSQGKLLAELISCKTKEQILRGEKILNYILSSTQIVMIVALIYITFEKNKKKQERQVRERHQMQVDMVAGEQGQGGGTCVICLERQRGVIHLPCRHFSICRECDQQVNRCPICRTVVQDKIIVHSA